VHRATPAELDAAGALDVVLEMMFEDDELVTGAEEEEDQMLEAVERTLEEEATLEAAEGTLEEDEEAEAEHPVLLSATKPVNV
jgi:hypothetical protein